MLSAEDVEDSYIKYQTYEDYFGITERDGKHYFGDKEVKKRENEGSESKDNEYYFVNEDGSLGESVRFALIDNPGTPFKFTDTDSESYYEEKKKKKGRSHLFYIADSPRNQADTRPLSFGAAPPNRCRFWQAPNRDYEFWL